MRYSNLFFGLVGIAVGVLLAPRVGAWNKSLSRKVNCGFKRTEAAVADAADDIIEKLEKGRKAVTT